jgi:hypothetical protein
MAFLRESKMSYSGKITVDSKAKCFQTDVGYSPVLLVQKYGFVDLLLILHYANFSHERHKPVSILRRAISA